MPLGVTNPQDRLPSTILKMTSITISPYGIYIVVGGPDGRWIGPLARLFKALVLSRVVSQNLVVFLAKRSKEVTPVVDKRYRLSEVPETIGYLEAGHTRGKVVITLDQSHGVRRPMGVET
jgi:D-arabinose 1-dehydrogenase-like Zn-dependent alcohol dehydrogenase